MNRYQKCYQAKHIFCPCPGATGATGAQGVTGATGAQGAQGVPGSMGLQGLQGVQGIQGETGAAGADGQSAFAAAQAGGYTGTEAEFNAALSNVSQAIMSVTIRANEVVTLAQYQAMAAAGELDPHTAYDIIEEVP